MNVLLIGSGGREHALAWKLAQSSFLTQLFVAPGNAGTADVATNLKLDSSNHEAVSRALKKHEIDMVVVGPEAPLVEGLVDFLQDCGKHPDLVVIGPRKDGAQLEGSKAFAKAFMHRHNIPTAAYGAFDGKQLDEALAFLRNMEAPYVLKADGLAAGKGVIITKDLTEAEAVLKDMLSGASFGSAGERVVIEQFMDGIECSMFVVTDGTAFHLLPSAKDYKRVGEGDTGPNTGGMGAISPVPFMDAEFHEKALNQIIIPTVKGLASEGISYNGFLFFGLMKVGGDPYVVEYNCRLGDPETEVILPRIQSDLLHLFENMGAGLLSEYHLQIDPRTCSTVMLVSEGYPGSYESGKAISVPDRLDKDTLLFHAGTSSSRGSVVTNGGRVLACSAIAATPENALKKSYALVDGVTFEGKSFRRDIGQDVV
jgi:phosphoribosylamine---glycine ligase